MNVPLLDQAARDSFITGSQRHFSVIAPAGVGKTRALVERIIHLARQPEALDILPRLVLVTYSVRAAQEMQIRARAALQDTELPFSVKRAFDQVFFGTIHSYCLRLLQRFGDRLGFTSNWTLLDEVKQDKLWQNFLNSSEIHELLSALQEREVIFRFIPVSSVYEFARSLAPGPVPDFSPMPRVKFKVLSSHVCMGHPKTREAVIKKQTELHDWRQALVEKRGWTPLLSPPTMSDPAFRNLWHETFEPLHRSLEQNILGYGRILANAFAEYRLRRGMLTYEDQVRQASAILDLPDVQDHLQEEPPIILLDEAQDTDADQFQVLLKASGWALPEGPSHRQSLCIVGDFQQSIYSRAQSHEYRRVHERILSHERGTQSVFQVTFRCDHSIISFVNSLFPNVLNNEEGQCSFTPLTARPAVSDGQVYRWTCTPVPERNGKPTLPATLHIAGELAQHLKQVGLKALRADSWQQVAILCPRVSWLQELADAFVHHGLPVQVHSTRKERADRPAHRWLASLFGIMAHPEDSFEVAGVLREIFGFSDHDMAHFTEANGDRLRLDIYPTPGDAAKWGKASPIGKIAQTLNRLRNLSLRLLTMPLHKAAKELLIETRLEERLASLDIDAENDLEPLMADILTRSAAGATLHEMAKELQEALFSPADPDDELQNALQFLTSFKAKGLEWQAVVLPFLFRQITFRDPPYPRLNKSQTGEETILLRAAPKPFQEKDAPPSPLTESERAERQSNERLMYVATTRAKHTLVLVDDEAVWAKVPVRRRSGWSSGDLLGVATGGQNRPIWDALPTEPTEPEFTPRPARPVRSLDYQDELFFRDDEPPADKLRPLGWADVLPAIQRAKDIPNRVTPHSLAKRVESFDYESSEKLDPVEDRADIVLKIDATEGTSDSDATLYGLWWHAAAERSPWNDGIEAVHLAWQTELATCPQPERGLTEYTLLQQSTLLDWLTQPGRLIRAECPFLWPEQTQHWIEGIMDLLAFEAEDQTWHVIDWKTNRDPDATVLGAQYNAQIEAYCKALQSIFRAPVVGSLYLTGSGEWVQLLRLEI